MFLPEIEGTMGLRRKLLGKETEDGVDQLKVLWNLVLGTHADKAEEPRLPLHIGNNN